MPYLTNNVVSIHQNCYALLGSQSNINTWICSLKNVDIKLYLSKVSPQFSVNIVLPKPKCLLESENNIKWKILF